MAGPAGRSASFATALEDELRGAATVAEASDLLVDALERRGFAHPSLYLELGERLRCQAQRGYWQVLDGIPRDLGMLGRCLHTGRTVEVDDASTEAEFLVAAPELFRLIAVPLHHGARAVGALAVESHEPFPPGARSVVEAAGEAYERRLAELGGPPAESPAQRVARLAAALSALDREDEVMATAVDAAIQVSGLSTAAIVRRVDADRAVIVTSHGPLAAALSSVEAVDLGRLDTWVAAGSSMYADGTGRSDLDAHGGLREVGIAALAVVPLTASGAHLGSLVVAEDVPCSFRSPLMPILEILGAQTAASIRAARSLAQSELRARRDPLTELGHHATFHEELRARLAHPVEGRTVALLIVDVDDFKRINDERGHQEGDRVLQRLATTLATALRSDDRLYRIGGDEFATLVGVATPAEARHIGERMLRAVQDGQVTVSIGLAMAASGEEADELVARADRAMYDAKRAGRDALGIAADPHAGAAVPGAAPAGDGAGVPVRTWSARHPGR